MKRRDFLKLSGSLFTFTAFARKTAFFAAATALAESALEEPAMAQTIPVVALRKRRPIVAAYDSKFIKSEDGYTWSAIGDLPYVRTTSGNWQGAAWCNSVYCAITDTTSCATSPTGATWTERTLPFAAQLISATGSLFVVTSSASQTSYATSADGITWTTRTLPLGDSWSDLIWNGSQLLLIGEGTVALTSNDGLTWTQRTLPASPDSWVWRYAAWNGSTYVIVAPYSLFCARSPDGITWTTAALPPSGSIDLWTGVAAKGSTFVIMAPYANTTLVSTDDGLTWSSGGGSTASVVAGNASIFVSARAFAVYSSTTGTSWTLRSSVTSSWRHIVFAGSLFIVLGDGANRCLTSSDGITFTSRTMPTVSIAPRSGELARTKSALVLTDGSKSRTILRSTNGGVTWTANHTALPAANQWWTLGANETQFVAITGNASSNAAAISPDGLTWTAVTLPATQNWTRVIWNGTIWSAFGVSTTAATSTDGVTWTSRTMPLGGSYAGAATDGKGGMCLIASGTVALTSPDGLTWTQRPLPVSATWSMLVWNGSVYTLTDGTLIYTSPDGITWTQRVNVLYFITSLVFNGAYLIAGGISNEAAISNDGLTWTLVNSANLSTLGLNNLGNLVTY